MSIYSDLQVLQNHLSEKLEIETSLVVCLQQSILQEQSLVIWPWLIENLILQELPSRTVGGDLIRYPPLRAKIHLLMLSNDLNLLSRARTVVHENTALFVDEARRLTIRFSPLTTEQACSIFLASGVPMQTALSLILDT
jgi:hypothetical protein